MNNAVRCIMYIALSVGWISIVYFFGLILNLHILATAAIALGSLALVLRKLQAHVYPKGDKAGFISVAILVTGIVILTNKADELATAYGEWDAWAIWNLHAKYLADPQYWQNIFLNHSYAHSDYPLAVPATIAFFTRLLPPGHLNDISFAFHCLVLVCIPLLIYLMVMTKSKIVAAIAFLLIATNQHYIQQGVAQYADTLLAFFFLCAFVAIDHYWEDKQMTAIAGFMLGCCLWTKNEGAIIAIIFILFYSRLLFHKSRISFFAAGILLPLLAWSILKIVYTPENDVISKQGSKTFSYLLQPERYVHVSRYFFSNLYQYFAPVLFGLALYLLRCVSRRQLPAKQVLLLACCALAYCGVYIITPQDLEWHLSTSQNRLMHQLMPAMMYALAMQFSSSVKRTDATGGFSVHAHPL